MRFSEIQKENLHYYTKVSVHFFEKMLNKITSAHT